MRRTIQGLNEKHAPVGDASLVSDPGFDSFRDVPRTVLGTKKDISMPNSCPPSKVLVQLRLDYKVCNLL